VQIFVDRKEAGAKLASVLSRYRGREDVLVLGLPRGGVVVAAEVARILDAPLDVLIVRKLGFPGQPEFGIGAVAETGTVVWNTAAVARFAVPESYLEQEIAAQKEEIARRARAYRAGRTLAIGAGRAVILVDDGVATGSTLKAAIVALQEENLARLVVAVPVAPPETAEVLRSMADEFFCLATPEEFYAVGAFYQVFTQTPDSEVVRLLAEAAERRKADAA
jgi:putative phosphoribosyl transferase